MRAAASVNRAVVPAALACIACSLFEGPGDYPPRDAGAADAVVLDGATCPSDMIPASAGGAHFCIDQYEVTVGDYGAFVSATPVSLVQQIPGCAFKQSIASGGSNGGAKHPVSNVDWCDAQGYCTAHGKRLCKSPAGADEWLAACSASGTRSYPYGAHYDASACNGTDAAQNATLDVGASTGCVGGLPNLYDMSGNVAEWVDACDRITGENDSCPTRGGSYLSDMNDLACARIVVANRGQRADGVGFRCCM
jgi:formylglycine-generating enzyme required for sulfatase activity